jgi:hypothetical protein
MNIDITIDNLSEHVLGSKRAKKGFLETISSVAVCTPSEARKLSKAILDSTEGLSGEELMDLLEEIRQHPTNPLVEAEAAKQKLTANIGPEELWKDKLEFKERYVLNKETDHYIVYLKSAGRNIAVRREDHDSMLRAYSNYDGNPNSINDICQTHRFPRAYWSEYKNIFGWTHDMDPVTDERLTEVPEDQIVRDLIQQKRFAVRQKFEKEDWKETQNEAAKWRAFKNGSLDPFSDSLKNFEPDPVKPIQFCRNSGTSNDIFLIGLSDLHFGGIARSSELFKGEDFNAAKIKVIINDYAKKIAVELDQRQKNYKEVIICSLGDILHTLTGETVKGTALEAEVLREEQFELAFDCLIQFFIRMLELFPSVNVYAVKGNHAGAGDYILFKTIAAYFRTEKRINFNLFKSRQACFKVGSTAILMDHGASDMSKSTIPTNGTAKEAYVQALFLQYPEVLPGAKCKLMLQGDRHRFMYQELRGFDHVIMGSCVLGDRYADNLGLHSRARQNCLVINDDGLKEVISFYFD